ncbi:DNA protecting protein DprA [Beutenbergia cavernae DSM 12333]|uniref:DNA protecting protein DprA n=1 Tax=Beutenbergia cavernae (strain ATCC BAA-8 / DSM 12333 / CCUG 43141 / JCM 11478 / NBRC 16432 / NCIMB 13614 / HKI 0122) TaxID=471853 RepID=C5BWU5_BEUC1|nr:DNA-processing protein DprA [Beutenbergia cavernae]ACQ80761.1 DNA protecting protein DprA [Beutenbergia cavernae DSM 12333]
MAELVFDAADPVLATVAWNRLAEPGDVAAARLLGALSPVAALSWLTDPVGGVPCAPEDPRGWDRARARWEPRLIGLDPRRELATIRRFGGRVVLPSDPWWPAALADLAPYVPVCLWVRGDPAVLAAPGLAIVGSRAASSYGVTVAADIAAGVASSGHVVISGGAYGIDAAAHRGALAVGGPTVAVLAGGLDRFYPPGNSDLLRAVGRDGALVAELPPGSSPSRPRFLLRNRLIAALAGATLVVEAAWRSGALNTARQASDLLRPIGAVPGSVSSAVSAGCHRMVREMAATLVTDVAEALELLLPIGAAGESTPPEVAVGSGRPGGSPADLAPREALVWDALPRRAAAQPDSVARVAGLGVPEVRAALGRLELAGHALRDAGGWRRA